MSPVAPVTMGTDGGMNRVFAAKLETTGRDSTTTKGICTRRRCIPACRRRR